MAAAYYAATAIAAVVYFAPDLRRRPGALLATGILSALGALLIIVAFVASAVDMARPEYVGESILGVGTVFWIGIAPWCPAWSSRREQARVPRVLLAVA